MAQTAQMLRQERAKLADYAQIVHASDIPQLLKATRSYAKRRNPVDLGFVQYEGVFCTKAWQAEVILISAEDLAGPLPGPRSTSSYAAVPSLAAALHEAWDEALPGVDIVFAFTTRAPAAWLNRVYDMHLRSGRMTLSAGRFFQQYAAAADAQAVAVEVQGAVPDAAVATIRLEQCAKSPLGPVGPLLDLAEVPQVVQDTLGRFPAGNPGLSRQHREAFLL
ncbi:MAG: hypothetical protein AAFN94_15770, partial [Pseudomonadota bacterium]